MEKISYKNKTVGEIVTNDFRTAELFKSEGIDFCCGGNQYLENVCLEKKIDIQLLEKKIYDLETIPQSNSLNFKEWNLDFLCDYIVNTHHKTVEKYIPQLLEYTDKIANVHGKHHPELIDIRNLFEILSTELLQHLQKEEEVLFPTIKEILKSQSSEAKKIIESEILRMTKEHDFAGSTMDKINELSKKYVLPDDACNTYMLTYKLLEEFENDLHIHVHIENNILYPKALQF